MNPEPEAPKRRTAVFLLALTALAAAVRVPNLWKPWAGDELSALLFFARRGWDAIVHPWSGEMEYLGTANHPVSSAQMWALAEWFNRSDAWLMRLPSLALGLAAIPLAYAVTWQASRDRTAARAAAVILTFSYAHVVYSAQARGYVHLVFFELAALWCLLRFMQRARLLDAAGYVIACACMAWSHLVAVFVAAGIGAGAGALWLFERVQRGARGGTAAWRVIAIAMAGGLAMVVAFSPYLPLVDIAVDFVRESKLPERGLGNTPGLRESRDVAVQPVEPYPDFVFQLTGWNVYVGSFFVLAAAVGLALLTRRQPRAGIVLWAILFATLTVAFYGRLTVVGRYFLFLYPLFIVGLAVAVSALAARVPERNRPAVATGALALIAMLLAIPSASFGFAPSMTLAGPYRLDAVDAYLQAHASDEDIVLLYPQGPPETSLGHPSFYSPYGHYYRLGGLGKQGYSLELPRERRVYYATPAALDDERAYLPAGAAFEPVETFGRTTLYAATIPSPPLAFHAAPGPWQVVVPPDGTPPAVSVPTGVSSSGTALDIRIETTGAEGWIAGQPLPVKPGGLVIAQLHIQGAPRYNTVHRAALQLVFLDANGARVGEDAAAPLHEVQHPSGSGWNVLRIARFAPPGTVRVQPRIRIDRYTKPGDALAVRDFVLLLEPVSR